MNTKFEDLKVTVHKGRITEIRVTVRAEAWPVLPVNHTRIFRRN